MQKENHILSVMCSGFKTDQKIITVKCFEFGFQELKALVVVAKYKGFEQHNTVGVHSGCNVCFLCNINANINHGITSLKRFGTV